MKIAIQGHELRGKKVIQILESLGGKNIHEFWGNGKDYEHYYHINTCGIITLSSKYDLDNYKLYTLEEFEKEFPFKIGDEVTIIGLSDFPKIITQMVWDCDETLYSFEGLNNTWFDAKSLKKLEMKEERNITLTLDKAKEWYKKGGELKEIALQAFTEQELNPLPRSWEEFVESTKFTFNCSLEYINGIGQWSNGCLPNKSIGESSEILDKYLALFQLEQLRNYWIQNRTYKWDDHSFKYQIKFMSNHYEILTLKCVRNFLTFPTREMAEEFLKCFRNLIEKAGDLI